MEVIKTKASEVNQLDFIEEKRTALINPTWDAPRTPLLGAKTEAIWIHIWSRMTCGGHPIDVSASDPSQPSTLPTPGSQKNGISIGSGGTKTKNIVLGGGGGESRTPFPISLASLQEQKN